PVGQQVGGRDAQPCRPDSLDRGRRTAALQVAEDGDPGLEAGRLLDPGAERVTHPLFGELHVTEGIPLLRCRRDGDRRLERPHLHPLGYADDAESLSLTPTMM